MTDINDCGGEAVRMERCYTRRMHNRGQLEVAWALNSNTSESEDGPLIFTVRKTRERKK
ncbi:hypothetical protein CLE01_34000 [Cryobacterium levicorallinum]|nr:hypothetical protein CLE01_34000 [Cryobacterium levicorallinum]